MQLIMLPLRGWLRWELGFHPPQLAKPRRGAKWSVFDVLGYTAFAAFALAFIRLLDLWIINGGANEFQRWVSRLFMLKSVLIAIGASAAGLAILLHPIPWRWRLAAIALAATLFFAGEFGYYAALRPARLGPWPVAAAALGILLASLTNFAILRLGGMQLWRQTTSSDTRSGDVARLVAP
jgi:hypothetical protein